MRTDKSGEAKGHTVETRDYVTLHTIVHTYAVVKYND